MTLSMSPPVSPLGMPQGAATFMGTCSREEIDCVSGALMPEVLEGEGSVFGSLGGVGGRGRWSGLGMSTWSADRGRGAGQHGAGLRHPPDVHRHCHEPWAAQWWWRGRHSPQAVQRCKHPGPSQIHAARALAPPGHGRQSSLAPQSSVLEAPLSPHLYPPFPAFPPGQCSYVVTEPSPPQAAQAPHQRTVGALRKGLGNSFAQAG